MPIPALKQAPYAGWKNALWLEQGDLSLILVPQVGGRIMGVRWRDRDLYWVNDNLAGNSIDVAAIANPAEAKLELGFKLWGGNKTWLAPQNQWTAGLPFLDLDSGAYQASVSETPDGPNTVHMQSRICRETGIQITRSVTLTSNGDGWNLIHRLQNHGQHPVAWAPWSNSMVRRPARVFLPKHRDSAFPDGVKTFDNEGDSVAARPQVLSHQEGVVAVDCVNPFKFKFGVDSHQGAVLAICLTAQPPYLGLLQTFPTFPPQTYGHGCSAEVFNASKYSYLELETHGPVQELFPGESMEFVEQHRGIELPTATPEIEEIHRILAQASR
jgi:hypothetical protein